MQIWDLFQGYEHAYGQYDIKRVNDKGKNEGKAVTYSKPITQEVWDIHLAGTGPGVGIIPLMSDNTVVWGVIDIDIIGIDHKELEDKCKKLGLPLVICRSKSGGAHAFLFMKEPTEASIVVEALASWAASLGYGGCEIFPKQTMRYDAGDGSPKDIGNWLNMPYFFADKTNRYCIKDGEVLDLQEFLEFAESMKVDESALIKAKPIAIDGKDINTGIFEEGPPCLQILYQSGGFPDGTRNDGMYNVGVYLKKRFPDDWQDKLQEYNVEMCDPPLTLAEINVIQKSVGKKDYDYRCRKPPIAPHCHRRMCMGRKCGVGEGAEGGGRPEILDVKKWVGDPTLWFVTVNGQRLMFTTDELLTQPMFKKRIADAISRVPRTIPQERWDRYIDELIQNCEVEYAPVDATPYGQFKIILEQYLLGQARTTTKEQLADSNSPFITGDGEVWFKLRGLLRHLDNQGFKYKSEHHVAQMLKSDDIGGVNKPMHVKGKGFNIWIVKEPESSKEPDPENNFGTQVF